MFSKFATSSIATTTVKKAAAAMTTATATATANNSSSTVMWKHSLPLLWKSLENPYASTGKWILGTAGMVVGMIHVGGITRLTQSGLSMTSWTLTGGLPPTSEQGWLEEFERYKQYPEWRQRKSMTLSDFQFIYAWEYGHRMLGRMVGVVFIMPWLYFTVKRKIPTGYQGRMVGLLAMGGTQGLVGWWMVKSGLGNDRREDSKEIRVKPIRLATHLGMAMATYGALLWTGLDILSLPHLKEKSVMALIKKSLSPQALQLSNKLRIASLAVSGLTFVTIISGALVAGNDAGRAYNMWPKMTEEYWIPPANVLWELKDPWWRNLVETTATVQFNHRMLGTATAISALSVAGVGLFLLPATAAAGTSATATAATVMTPQVRNGLIALGLAATGQFALGVTTLLQYVPFSLAAAHQLGSVVVFSSGIYLSHALRYAAKSGAASRIAATTAASASASASSSASNAAVATAAAATRGISTYSSAATTRAAAVAKAVTTNKP